MYYYFVSYSYEDGFGCSEVSRNTPITTLEDIKEIIKKLQKSDSKLSSVVILNYQLLQR